jgi:hypothetical protein
MPFVNQSPQEGHHLPFIQLARMTTAMEAHEPPNPADIGLLGPQAIVPQPQLEPQNGQQARIRLRRGGGRGARARVTLVAVCRDPGSQPASELGGQHPGSARRRHCNRCMRSGRVRPPAESSAPTCTPTDRGSLGTRGQLARGSSTHQLPNRTERCAATSWSKKSRRAGPSASSTAALYPPQPDQPSESGWKKRTTASGP